MAAVFEKTYIQDLTGRLIIRYCPEIVFSKDNLSNKINVKLYVGSNKYAGGGTVTATVIRSDGNTVPVSGSISGNVASVTLIEPCMDVPGQIQVFIRLTSGNVKTTIFAGVFTASRTETDTIIDPGTIIPSITELINQIDAAIDSIPADYSTLLGSVAGTYSASKTYAVGDYVWYDGALYRCTTAISTAESWTAAHWTAAVLGNDISVLKSALNSLSNVVARTNACNPDENVVGLLDSSGKVKSSYTTRITTGFIPVTGDYVSAYCHQEGYSDIGSIRIAFYDNDKELINIIATSPSIVNAVNNAKYVRASFATGWAFYFVGFSSDNAKIEFEEYYPTTLEIKESVLPARITATDNWLYKFAECSFSGRNVHLSIDDVGYALYDLITNTPTSLWDSTFFGQLKTLHDTYGICVTCNCFSFVSTAPSYDIANVPNTWAAEFVAAKDWLKFSFHAKNDSINYNSATSLASDYAYFVNAIYSMTGDYECIDTGVRLNMFTGTKEQIEQAMNVPHGITMLWTADDSRNSYYFDNAQTARVDNRSKYIDDTMNLLFVRSMPRLDNNTIDTISALIDANPQYNKMVELYCHENLSGIIASGTITRINNALAWFGENGYKSHFLTEIFK